MTVTAVLACPNAFATSYGVDIGDFNADGNPDIAALANDPEGIISILLGQGDGTFLPATNITVPGYTHNIIVADLNLDGKDDLAVVDQVNSRLRILQGTGDGTFQSPVSFPTGQNPYSLVSGDVNNDGKPDVIVDDVEDASISVMLNTCLVPSPTPTDTGTPLIATFTATPSPTAIPPSTTSTATPQPTITLPAPTSTMTSTLTSTRTPVATNSPTSIPTATNIATGTWTPLPTGTPTSTPTVTDTPATATSTATSPTTNTPAPTGTPLSTATPTDCANPFVDITGNVFYGAIHYLACRGVVNGTDATHYEPSGTSTRGQFAKVVVLGFGLPFYTPTTPDFTDVPTTHFAYLYIETGFHAGILSGFDAATCTAHGLTFPCYQPNIAITRGQLTKLVVSAAGYELFTPTGGQPTFTDVLPSNVFFVSIETAAHKGVVSGFPDGTFRPNNFIRRDEMAQIVYKGVITP